VSHKVAHLFLILQLGIQRGASIEEYPKKCSKKIGDVPINMAPSQKNKTKKLL
jgi:hypothetical protein